MAENSRRRISVADAEALIRGRLGGWGTLRVPIDAAMGEILRQTITAERDQPPFDRVTMDGIAIRHSAFAGGLRTFTVAGTQGAGSAPVPLTDERHCVAIMTGAALPPGADTVVPVERITRETSIATIAADYQPASGQCAPAERPPGAFAAGGFRPRWRSHAAAKAMQSRYPAITIISRAMNSSMSARRSPHTDPRIQHRAIPLALSPDCEQAAPARRPVLNGSAAGGTGRADPDGRRVHGRV
jgi:hypothetical protein